MTWARRCVHRGLFASSPSESQIRHETLRVSVVQRLEEYLGIGSDGTVQAAAPPRADALDQSEDDSEDTPVFEPFKDFCKRRFMWYFSSYVASIEKGQEKAKEDENFVRMPFESPGNTMDGKFRYGELDRRLRLIRKVLDKETDQWAKEGVEAKRVESGIAANLERQFEQTVEFYKQDDSVTLDFELVDGNPFVWRLTYFGRPMTNLDGGLFRFKVCFSPRFPDEQPRVRCETVLFHHRISDDGVVCYFPRRPEDAKAHIEALIEALEEESPPYDPRTTVNPTAAKLYWGTPAERKEYNRRLRRAVQRTLECVVPLSVVAGPLADLLGRE